MSDHDILAGAVRRPPRHRHRRALAQRVATVFTLAVMVSGCTTLGPDFARPEVNVEKDWIYTQNPDFKPVEPADKGRWWEAFGDPVLDRLIELAYRQNLTLKTAGIRILEARAQLGIAVGDLYPQQQQATADATLVNSSRNAPNTVGGDLSYVSYDTGLTADWELDFWGRFARGIESADASLLASVASYDDVLVSLAAQVASTYITLRVLEQRIEYTHENIELQKRGLQIARVKFRNGATTELDALQAETLLRETQASGYSLEGSRRTTINALATLLGMTPREANELVYGSGAIERLRTRPTGPVENSASIPTAPPDVAIGIPADLLRRRPDVRLAELQAWAQSAAIGLAQADLYPSIALVGTIGLTSGDRTNSSRHGSVGFDDLFDSSAVRFQGGPAVTWNVFNYGRIKNSVRVQDARLQQLLVDYQNTVLAAGQEVEDAMAGFLQSQFEAEFFSKGVAAARRSVSISLVQYRDGATDYTTVLDTQRQLASQEDSLAQARGAIVQNLVSMYRSLGGGWQIREGQDFVSEDTREQMRERTDWGGLLDPEVLEDLPPMDEERETWRSPDW